MLRHDLAVVSGLMGVACSIAFAVAVVTDEGIGLRILAFMPVAAAAMLVGDHKTVYVTPPGWLALFAGTNAALSVAGLYLTWFAQTMEGLSGLVPLTLAFASFLGVSVLSPLVILRGVRERRPPRAPAPNLNYQSSRGLA